MRSAARDASRRSVGAPRRDDDDGGDEETRPPATPADEEVEVASVAADEAPATKRAMMSHGGASGFPVQVQPLALQISSHSNVSPLPSNFKPLHCFWLPRAGKQTLCSWKACVMERNCFFKVLFRYN
jgi:hypothetical protein